MEENENIGKWRQKWVTLGLQFVNKEKQILQEEILNKKGICFKRIILHLNKCTLLSEETEKKFTLFISQRDFLIFQFYNSFYAAHYAHIKLTKILYAS